MDATDLSDIKPLERGEGQRAPGAIFDYLRELILDGVLAPQTVISQVALADRLGVSRTPLREALRRLQQEGLIEAEPNRRARVVGFDPDDLELVYASRIFYEPLGLFQTVPHLHADDLEKLAGELANMRRASDANEYAAWELAHREFHRALALYATDSLQRQIATFSARGDRYRRLYQSSISRSWNVGDPEHEAILTACRSRDPDLAAGQLARHLASIAIALLARVMPEREPAMLRAAFHVVSSGTAGKPPRAIRALARHRPAK